VSEQEQKNQQISLLPILSVNFLGTLGFSIVMPFLVFLVTQWGGNALIYGIIGAAYSFFQLIGAPVLGRWSDRIGRRKVLLVSQLGTLASWLILLIAFFLPEDSLLAVDSALLGSFTLTLPLLVVFLARAADGLTGGNVSVASAYLADITEENKRSENFGKLAISANLGFIVGPALAGLLGSTSLGEILPVLAALGISVVASLIIAARLPESNACMIDKRPESEGVRKVFGQEHKECFELKGEKQASLSDILKIKNIPLLLSLYFLIMLAFNFFYIAFPVYAATSLNWSISDTGLFFTFLSVCMVLAQGPILKRASKRWPDGVLVTAGSLLLTCGFFLYCFPSEIIIYAGTALLSLGNGLMWSSLVSLLSKAAGSRMQGAVQGFAGSAGAVASIIGLLIGGIMYGFLERWIFVLAAVVIGIVFVASFRLAKSGGAHAVGR
jgi:MFS family permease